MISSSTARRVSQAVLRRGVHTRRKTKDAVNLPGALAQNFPTKMVEPTPETAEDPSAYQKSPVTSAHAIDIEAGKVSTQDSVAISPDGKVVHGRYGELGEAADGVPLEYLALLRMAAEGAAGLRKIEEGGKTGTVMVFGASQASGLAAVQLASANGHAVVGVVGAEHSCHEDMVEYVKGMIPEPGTAVAEEYAIAKKNFADLVNGIASGDEGLSCYDADECLEDFKANLLEYVEAYPETLPAAVDPSKMKFLGMEKDKDTFRTNMEAYLAQFPPGAPPIAKDQLDTKFTNEQYEVFRSKFWEQTTNVVSGDESHFFSPPHIAVDLMKQPQKMDKAVYDTSHPSVPYSFTTVNNFFPVGTQQAPGGPIAGAIIVVTPNLETAATAVDAAKTLREKAEALQFLSDAEKSAFSAASSVAALATKAGAPVYTVGGRLPGLTAAAATDADVQEALNGMAIQDDGSTKLDYFVQAYRASDFPFYADYAVHRATEVLAGPRQIVVTK
mmetsp:Transcript_18458/g.45756  ORF Transcript_18458/g.45756 Transcript_18458/m.45756 type:complete len:500 (-) Transcript_18458:26-1525(-)|eukprot:CAMPEP_0113614920 /NCGR_PEP_ID=MMETSP0017_2-20120614/7424_1 /TAXON_ID=2856 /ORGANISM="Cylindrotheca closterium" /LENGTH=499 /DNA_ID=CAMNT_0000524121 /DNA_START=104 /DNA_END=1603 /DNA_ORIENTATION=+ /assembly_acc=CAM_ASM_000147